MKHKLDALTLFLIRNQFGFELKEASANEFSKITTTPQHNSVVDFFFITGTSKHLDFLFSSKNTFKSFYIVSGIIYMLLKFTKNEIKSCHNNSIFL